MATKKQYWKEFRLDAISLVQEQGYLKISGCVQSRDQCQCIGAVD